MVGYLSRLCIYIPFQGGVLIDSKNIEHELHSIRNRIIVIGLGQCQALLIDSKNIEHELRGGGIDR